MAVAASNREEKEREFTFGDREFRYLAELVYERSGIVLGNHKKDMVYSRLARRLRALGLGSFKEYCAMLSGDGGEAEMGMLINAITTNLTRFFRESHHFDHLRNTVLHDAVARGIKQGNRRIRIWSAGCSSGEEPYSIAMTVCEAIPNIAQWDVKILATDLDTNMVASGRAGQYRGDALDGISKSLQTKYLKSSKPDSDGRVVMSDALRQLITFKQLNLLGPWPMKGPFDAIFCRNVMIYFDMKTKSALVDRFAELLPLNGWLYVGHSESLLEGNRHFKLQGRTIYRKIA